DLLARHPLRAWAAFARTNGSAIRLTSCCKRKRRAHPQLSCEYDSLTIRRGGGLTSDLPYSRRRKHDGSERAQRIVRTSFPQHELVSKYFRRLVQFKFL